MKFTNKKKPRYWLCSCRSLWGGGSTPRSQSGNLETRHFDPSWWNVEGRNPPDTGMPRCYQPEIPMVWLFRDVVFQDVGFENNSFKPLTHISFRCEVPTPSVFEGRWTIMIKPHILKHHIPELPSFCCWILALNWDALPQRSTHPCALCPAPLCPPSLLGGTTCLTLLV